MIILPGRTFLIRFSALFSILLCAAPSVRAQAPDSIADSTIMWSYDESEEVGFTIVTAANDFYSLGQFWQEVSARRGTFAYSRTNQATGVVTLLKINSFNPFEQPWAPNPFAWTPPPGMYLPTHLNFLTSLSGYVDIDYSSYFERFVSNAPETLQRKTIRIVTKTTESGFPRNDFFQPREYLITFVDEANYHVSNIRGTFLHAGTYTWFKPNRPTLVCKFNRPDSDPDKFLGVFAFSASTSGKGMVINEDLGDNFHFTITDCSYDLSSNFFFVSLEGIDETVVVSATAACPWIASTTNDWIQITSEPSGNGTNTIHFTVAPNPTGAPRNGMIRIAGRTVTVAQAGDLAPLALAEKTLYLTTQTGSSVLPERAKFIASPTAQNFTFVPLSTDLANSSGAYSFTRISATNAVLSFDGRTVQLQFTKAGTGTFIATGADTNSQTGTFVLSLTAPDFNADTRGDLLFHNTNGVLASWFMDGTTYLGSNPLRNGIASAPGNRAVAAADFNNDGISDLVLQNQHGVLSVWLMEGTNQVAAFPLRDGISASPWRAFSATDLRANGQRDILLFHPDGRLGVWTFDQANFISGRILRNGRPLAQGWKPIGTADFNSDLQPDLLLQHTNGQLAIGWLNAGEYVGTDLVRNGQIPPPHWRTVGTGDLTEDGKPDILWRNTNNQLALWMMNEKHFVSSTFLRGGLAIGSQWRLIAPR